MIFFFNLVGLLAFLRISSIFGLEHDYKTPLQAQHELINHHQQIYIPQYQQIYIPIPYQEVPIDLHSKESQSSLHQENIASVTLKTVDQVREKDLTHKKIQKNNLQSSTTRIEAEEITSLKDISCIFNCVIKKIGIFFGNIAVNINKRPVELIRRKLNSD